MDHSFPTETRGVPLPAALAALAARVAGFIGTGGRAVVLLGPAGAGKTAVLDTVLSALPGRQTRIRNPGPAPLTLKRILRQMSAPPDALTSGHFFRTLAEQAYDDESATIAVDDAHSLSPHALASLARIPGLGGPELPGMILFLAGEATLLGKLSAPGLELLRNSRRALVLTLPDSAAARTAPETASAARLMWTTLAPEPPPIPAPPLPPAPAPPEPELLIISGTGPRAWQAALAGAVLATAFAMSTLWTSRVGTPPTPPALPAPVALPAPAAPIPPAEPERPPAASLDAPPTPASPPDTTAEPTPPPLISSETPRLISPEPPRPVEPSDTQLRRGFDIFLDRAGRDTAKLTPPAREALFREYLAWRAKGPATPP